MTALEIVEAHRTDAEQCLASIRGVVGRLRTLGMTDFEILAGLDQAWRGECLKRSDHGQK